MAAAFVGVFVFSIIGVFGLRIAVAGLAIFVLATAVVIGVTLDVLVALVHSLFPA
jgi:hypothetical protein